MSSSLLSPSSAAFLCCDVQEKFRTLIRAMDSVIDVAKYMVRASSVLNVPLIVTEQVSGCPVCLSPAPSAAPALRAGAVQAPHLFGATVPEIPIADPSPPQLLRFTKSKFSMMTDEVSAALRSRPAVTQCVLFGIEAHVCVLQTALDLRGAGYAVHVLVDGTSSQRTFDRTYAFRRMEQSGVLLTTSESCLLQLTRDAAAPHFKAVAALLKEQNRARPDPML